ncbi:MAG: hypothetical protein ABEL04_11635, partial [Salinibacter sp.]|uniref:hypothetical protein n=1 Tax=Salinibacter sp. TaxID=2065818 RepID=UPI0035D48347
MRIKSVERGCPRNEARLRMEEGEGRFGSFYEVHLHAAACISASARNYDTHLTGVSRMAGGTPQDAAAGVKRLSARPFKSDRNGHSAGGRGTAARTKT